MEQLTPRAVRDPDHPRWVLLACVVCHQRLEDVEERRDGVCSILCAGLAREAREAFDDLVEDDLAPGSPAAARWKSTMEATRRRRRDRAGDDDKENRR